MNDNFPTGLSRIVAVAAIAITATIGTRLATAEEPTAGLWLVSTRGAPLCCTGNADQPLDYWRSGPDGQWLPTDREAFLATDDPAVPTSAFIHGNRVGRSEAFSIGSSTYRRLTRQAPGRAVRFVVWSWPSEEASRRRREDLQLKAARSDAQGLYLAQFINRIDPEVPVGLIGYSYGSRVITGALHILAGGSVAGYRLPEAAAERTGMRAVLVASAMGNHWLAPGHRNGLALSRLDRVLITQNCADPVLKWYHLLYGRGGPQALGYTGPACNSLLGDEAHKLEVLGLTCSVGKNHAWNSYLCSRDLQSYLAEYSFLDAPGAEPEDVASTDSQ